MNKKILLLTVLLMAIFFPDIHAYAVSPDEIRSAYAVLIDASTGQILFDKNMDAKAYPASVTKIMTGIIAVEKCLPDEQLTVSETAVDIDEPDSSNIALVPDERLSFDSAMYAMMLRSANDAANAIAEHTAGSLVDFTDMMNSKAAEIGAVNTHFVNAHGLHDDEHYTTARDIALITRYAIENGAFMQYFGADTYTMPQTNKFPYTRAFTNFQYMLLESSQYHDANVIGGKVGYTNEARHTMSTVATRDGRTLICVVLDSGNRNEKFEDTKKLLDYGFDEFSEASLPANSFKAFSVPIIDSGISIADAVFESDNDFNFLLHNSFDASSVRLEYSPPAFIGKGGKAEIDLHLFARGPEGISLVLSQTLKAKIIPLASAPSPVEEDENRAFYILIALCGLTAVIFFITALKTGTSPANRTEKP